MKIIQNTTNDPPLPLEVMYHILALCGSRNAIAVTKALQIGAWGEQRVARMMLTLRSWKDVFHRCVQHGHVGLCRALLSFNPQESLGQDEYEEVAFTALKIAESTGTRRCVACCSARPLSVRMHETVTR